MSQFKNFGIISSQRLLEEFEWKKNKFYSYLITFNEYDGYFRIIRDAKYEQSLIGAQMVFNYSSIEDKITRYRILGFEKKPNRLKELMTRKLNKK